MTIKNKKSPLKYAVMKDAPEEIIKSLINPSNFWGSLHLGFSPTSTAFKIPKIFNISLFFSKNRRITKDSSLVGCRWMGTTVPGFTALSIPCHLSSSD